MTISVKYCGTCNPRYDGAQAVRDLQDALGITFVQFDAATLPDISVVVAQCPSKCIDPKNFPGREATFLLERPEQVPEIARNIKAIM